MGLTATGIVSDFHRIPFSPIVSFSTFGSFNNAKIEIISIQCTLQEYFFGVEVPNLRYEKSYFWAFHPLICAFHKIIGGIMNKFIIFAGKITDNTIYT